ncbi:MAG: hypothetical protein Hyperionvirus5_22 [Hyperionvirus sp.]|uniref:Uncharacterized protein n=1 Tax=Hyperionvirus sp. TaxID=2487770 RepID=A0A3G5A7I4_9VIRU|nr:MAG: hypothetical protein Hyperionvirus5_22 [Hyperionvirus sp.]
MPRIDEKKTATAIAAAQQAALTETLVAPSVYTAPVVPPALPVLSATQAWIFTGEGCALTETLATPSAEAAQTSLRLERGIPDQSLTQTGNPRRFSLTDTMVYHGT